MSYCSTLNPCDFASDFTKCDLPAPGTPQMRSLGETARRVLLTPGSGHSYSKDFLRSLLLMPPTEGAVLAVGFVQEVRAAPYLGAPFDPLLPEDGQPAEILHDLHSTVDIASHIPPA